MRGVPHRHSQWAERARAAQVARGGETHGKLSQCLSWSCRITSGPRARGAGHGGLLQSRAWAKETLNKSFNKGLPIRLYAHTHTRQEPETHRGTALKMSLPPLRSLPRLVLRIGAAINVVDFSAPHNPAAVAAPLQRRDHLHRARSEGEWPAGEEGGTRGRLEAALCWARFWRSRRRRGARHACTADDSPVLPGPSSTASTALRMTSGSHCIQSGPTRSDGPHLHSSRSGMKSSHSRH